MSEFQLAGAIIMGLLIGIVELFFVHADEAGLNWMKHGIHAIPTCLIFTFISMNVPYVINLLGWAWLVGPIGTYGIPIIIGLVATIKVKGAAAVTQGHNAVGEKLGHAFIIGALIAVSPFVWPFIAPNLPAFLQF